MHPLAWQPSANLEFLRRRAKLLAQLREFFAKRSYLEVETPIMAQFGVTDLYLSNIKAVFRGKEYNLQTSPEYHMKRLLAAGSGPIFQLARVFRDDELGRWHNPEFSLLEWYQLGIDHHTLIEEVDLLLQEILHSKPIIKKTYRQAYIETCGLDPFSASIEQLKSLLTDYDLDRVLSPDEKDRDQYLFLLMSHVIEPALSKETAPVAVYDFPSSQASLAQIKDGFAQRFEVYYQGVELANGFHELTDFAQQKERFIKEQETRLAKGLAPIAIDTYLLQALEHGLPACSGVALGVDRLMALALGQPGISAVMAFDFGRA